MKTTLDLPEELVREVKLRAVLQRRTVKDLVAEYIRQGLGLTSSQPAPQPPPGSRVEIDEGGLPTIRCHRDAPAAAMTVEELLALEQVSGSDEDLKRVRIAL